jgi:hypothetical protein
MRRPAQPVERDASTAYRDTPIKRRFHTLLLKGHQTAALRLAAHWFDLAEATPFLDREPE